MKKTRFIPLVLASLAGILLVIGMNSKSVPTMSPLADRPVPDFVLPSLQQELGSITQASLKGDVQLLNVWASWCSICKSEHAYLQQLATEQSLSIIGLNYRDERKAALNELAQTGNPYKKVIYDPKGSLALDLGVYGTPETYLIDENGIIRHRYVGALTPTIWDQQFAPLVAQLKE